MQPAQQIEKIINLQNTNGSWGEKSLIQEVSKSPEKALALMKDIKAEIIITFLVSEWIQKYHPEKQYALLVKKAKSWLKKALEEVMLEEGKLEELKETI